MQLDKRASSKANHHNRRSIPNLSKDWAGTGKRDGVALHEISGVPLAETIRDGVAAHKTTGNPLAGMIKCKNGISVCCNAFMCGN